MSEIIKKHENGITFEQPLYSSVPPTAVDTSGTTTVDPTVLLTTVTGFSLIFVNLKDKRMHRLKIVVSNTTYIRLNSITADIIKLDASNSFDEKELVVDKIYIATPASVNVTIFAQ